jgi:hypothetical protein
MARFPQHLRVGPVSVKNVELSREQLPDHMREFAERENHMPRPQRSLIGSMRGERILLFTDLLVWYLEHGLVVDRIYQIVEYEANAVYREFGDSVTSARRAGDVDATQELLANTSKQVGNSLYGKTITDKTRHKNVSYDVDDRLAAGRVRSPYFHSINPLDEGVYETTTFKRSVGHLLYSVLSPRFLLTVVFVVVVVAHPHCLTFFYSLRSTWTYRCRSGLQFSSEPSSECWSIITTCWIGE